MSCRYIGKRRFGLRGFKELRCFDQMSGRHFETEEKVVFVFFFCVCIGYNFAHDLNPPAVTRFPVDLLAVLQTS